MPNGQLLGPAPEVTSRLGIDLNPVRLADPNQRAWLEAFIWPEDTSGLATLRGAIDLAVTAGIPPVVHGDATTDTARLLSALDGPLARRNGLSLAGVRLLGSDRRDDSLLALADPYLRWLAPARHAGDDFQWLPAGPESS